MSNTLSEARSTTGAPPADGAKARAVEHIGDEAPRTALVTNMGALLAAAGVLAPPVADESAEGQHPREKSEMEEGNSTAALQKTSGESEERRAAPRARSMPSAGSSPTALQDLFLNAVRREGIDCTLYLTNGAEERGRVRAFDTFTLLLENRDDRCVQLIYKHSVARILPARSPAALHERLAISKREAK